MPNFKHMSVHISTDFPVQCETQAHRILLSILDFHQASRKIHGTAGSWTVSPWVVQDSPILNRWEIINWKPISCICFRNIILYESLCITCWSFRNFYALKKTCCAVQEQQRTMKSPWSFGWFWVFQEGLRSNTEKSHFFPLVLLCCQTSRADQAIDKLQALSLWGEDEGRRRGFFSSYCLPYMGTWEIKLHLCHSKNIWEHCSFEQDSCFDEFSAC